MYVMYKNKWIDGFLPYHEESGVKILVRRWALLKKLSELYFVKSKDFSTLLNYYREIGIREVIKKTKSRMRESLRNEKFFSIGYGVALINSIEKEVVFIAPCHPMCVDQIVLPSELVFEVEKNYLKSDELLFYDMRLDIIMPGIFEQISGWSVHSGIDLSDIKEKIKKDLFGFYDSILWENAEKFSLPKESKKTRKDSRKKFKNNPSAAILGYGQYAKTNIIPNIKDVLEIKKIYEIDPLQISYQNKTIEWSTAATPSLKDNFDVFFIAGYHHMHAPIACQVIQTGAVAVVEKPAVINVQQLNNLLAVLEKFSGKLYTCYHKRYALFNDFVFKDLNCERGEAINFHCIVHEVPLPRMHWYNWPNSHSRIVSNGCHWIDYFLYLNNYQNYVEYSGFLAPDGTINCSVTLENGAFFSMVLTDRGSSRIGVQDYIELRNGSSTVKIVNGSDYFAENERKIIRKYTVNKLDGYAKMYRSIAKDIKLNHLSDSPLAVKRTNELILKLEKKLYPEFV